jgi:hypothetical protein
LLNNYARKVDQALRGVLAGRETPLVLAAAEPLASIFRSVNTYPRLVDDVIAGNPDHVTDAQLADAARPILDQLNRHELAAAIALFVELKPRLALTTFRMRHTPQPPGRSISWWLISTPLFLAW